MMTNDTKIDDKHLVSTNFDLEQNILKCWNLVDEIEELANDFESKSIDHDDLIAILRAYKATYQIRFERTFKDYETVCRGLHQTRRQLKDLSASLKCSKVVDQ